MTHFESDQKCFYLRMMLKNQVVVVILKVAKHGALLGSDDLLSETPADFKEKTI